MATKIRNAYVRLMGETELHVDKLVIKGINPDAVIYTVREYWDPEGAMYEVEHIPTGTTTVGWKTSGLGSAILQCQMRVEEVSGSAH